MKTITATVPAFITNNLDTPENMLTRDPIDAVSSMGYYKSPIDGWVQVGLAEVTVTLFDNSSFVSTKIEMLNKAKVKVQADCELALTQIEGQIQSLLAIECKSEVMA